MDLKWIFDWRTIPQAQPTYVLDRRSSMTFSLLFSIVQSALSASMTLACILKSQAFLSNIVTLIQVAAVAVAFGAETIAQFVGYSIPPALLAELKEKKVMIAMGAWFIGNTINNALTSTGAFEISYDDHVVFSKLATGHMPSSMDEIIQGILALSRKEE